MGIKQWAAGIIRKTPVTPAGPYQDSAASGIWTLDQVVYWLKQNLWPVAGNTNPSAFVENLFSTYLYTGNGSTQTITNGIDLSTYGGLVWSKDRGFSAGQVWYDTARGAYPTASYINSASTEAASLANGGAFANITGFNSNGYTIGSTSSTNIINYSGSPYVSWTFRKQPKFFDVVTYTGTGSATTITHNLGATPGCIIVKCTSTTSNWAVYHRGQSSASYYTKLNLIDAQASDSTVWNGTGPTSSVFSVGTSSLTNTNGATYVAYLFAHNAGGFGLSGTENVISCGSYTGSGAAGNPITLGYEPQWLLIKNTTDGTTNWNCFDNMRGIPTGSNDNALRPNSSAAEVSMSAISLTATGFQHEWSFVETNKAGDNYIYIAIRRGPMQVPTDGTKVFAPVARIGSGSTPTTIITGINADALFSKARNGAYSWSDIDRLRGKSLALRFDTTDAELNLTTFGTVDFLNTSLSISGTSSLLNDPGSTYASYALTRAPGFFDVVCYTGDGFGAKQNHNLGVVPEFMILKARSTTSNWGVACSLGNGNGITLASASGNFDLNTTGGTVQSISWNSTYPNTATQFDPTVPGGGYESFYANGVNYVAYLFATCPGVSKVGSYTGNGSSQTLNCGFTGGARFVLIKRTDSTGDWYVWDSARGIVAGTDPHLSLNTTAAEVTTDDSVDADSTGFIVNQLSATNVNVTSATYIYLAIA